MTTEDRDKLVVALELLLSALELLLSAGVTLTDILEIAVQAAVKNEGVEPSMAISRVHYWAHCKLDDSCINKGK